MANCLQFFLQQPVVMKERENFIALNALLQILHAWFDTAVYNEFVFSQITDVIKYFLTNITRVWCDITVSAFVSC